ncbi:hypothetical protein [Bernardetia sp.]|uniref:hypothetical protein n=1 Tax=Bernardetia sp. TaxID=1937974 RepID=UPI0025C72B6D|nr:hypothetical protein [Bernardetia sp.]
MKTEEKLVLILVLAAGAYFAYNHYQKRKTQTPPPNYQQQQQQQQVAQVSQASTANIGDKVNSLKTILDSVKGALTNKERQACLENGGTWDRNGLLQKGFCVNKEDTTTTEVASRGTEPFHRTSELKLDVIEQPAYLDKSQLQAMAGVDENMILL